MNSRRKKVLLIIIFLLLVILFSWFLWKLFFQTKKEASPKNIKEIINTTGLPQSGEGSNVGDEYDGKSGLPTGDKENQKNNEHSLPNKPISLIANGGKTKVDRVIKSPVLNPAISKNGQIQYYNRNDGKFYRVDQDGNIYKLSDKTFPNVKDVVWSNNKDKGIIEFPDGNKILYDFNKNKQVTLPKHWEEFSFSPSDDKIIAKSIGLDPENRWLVIADPDGSNAKNLEKVGTRSDYIYPDWSPNKQIVASYTKGIDYNRQNLFFIGLHGENFKSTVIEGRGLQSQWSNDGKKLLYSVYNSRDNYRPKLWVVDASGNTIGANRHSFSINTWASKCTFASASEVYCAVPQHLQEGAGLYPELADKTQDDLYKINLNTGTKQLVAIPEDAFNVSQIMVPNSQNYLYFTDKKTGELYKIKLR